jgi:fibronectin type 3 domain-containing protein
VAVSLTVSLPSTSTATLIWDANTETDLASYNVYRSTTPGVYGAAIANVPAGTVSYLATDLQAGTTYYFTITAVDSAGNESPYSTEVRKSTF